MDIDYLIRSFNTRVNLAKFPIPKNITLQFVSNTVIKKGYVAKTDYSEELKKLEKDAIELGIDIDKLKSEINNAFLEAQKTNKEKLIEKIRILEKSKFFIFIGIIFINIILFKILKSYNIFLLFGGLLPCYISLVIYYFIIKHKKQS